MITKAAIGLVAAICSIGGLSGVNVYLFHRQGDMVDNYVEMKREQSEIVRSINDMHVNVLSAIHNKEKACEVLEATITSGRYTHEYCKN